MTWLQQGVLILVTAVLVAQLPYWLQTRLPPVWSGYIAPGWKKVADIHRDMIESGVDRGSSFAVYHRGQLVLNLIGGYADEHLQRPWSHDTISMFYSCTKGVVAIIVAKLVERGLLDYKAKVSKYWPEFSQNGKADITLEVLLSHQSGLSVLDEDFKLSDLVHNTEKISGMLAKQKPMWKPGTKHGYMTLTFALYIDEIVKRVDPEGRNSAQIFQEEIANKYEIDFRIGLPNQLYYRLARTVRQSMFQNWESFTARHLWYNMLYYLMNHDKYDVFIKSIRPSEVMKPSWHTPENLFPPFGSVHGFGTAESLAKLYGLITSKEVDSEERIISLHSAKLLSEPLVTGYNEIAHTLNMTFGRGTSPLPSPVGSTMFGTPGHGGQVAYGDLEHELGFAYLTNYLSLYEYADNPKYIRLRDAMYECALLIEQNNK